ncbi:unnamed protein product [Schistosoma margrebowiei]|uniref:Uncharacterized protein n=1 Tax=Schistosoma margrebowiei TaxID=48269 RepID=A0A183MAS3_9TREM|nr:unnamed protein product [Schistosoma margrebowiei]
MKTLKIKEELKADVAATARIVHILFSKIEWNSSLYINFIDYEKAFDSVDRTTLWKLLRHYGVLQKIVNIIQSSYDGLHCKILHGGQWTKSFEVKTGVRQGCLRSPFFVLLVTNWIMETSISEGKHGIQWIGRMQLDDLDFADDLALLSHGQRRRGRIKNALRQETEKDMRKISKNWTEPQKKAQDRMGWRIIFGGLCSIRSNRCK